VTTQAPSRTSLKTHLYKACQRCHGDLLLNLAIIYAVVLGAALITAFLPARQASRVYPAQALRYE